MTTPFDIPPNKRITRLLIANRGEIASRIIRSCKLQNITTVAVFSEADRESQYVKEADLSVFIGPAISSQSYLNQKKIIEAAKQTNCQAIHPGYGFLSENSSFCQLVTESGLIFVGPTPKAIELMGCKLPAKNLLYNYDKSIPLIPGYNGDDQSLPTLVREAEKIGFPVLLKASAGGGGKGMRIVRNREDLEGAINSVKVECKNSFNDETILLEKYFSDGRHIEVQLVADQYSNIVHAFERECSVQRRHQKLIEETPSPLFLADPTLRSALVATAIKIGQAISYSSLGTVEFLYCTSSKQFYFLEVNTRLQVEHPITELTIQNDLVSIQLLIAQGVSLPQLFPSFFFSNSCALPISPSTPALPGQPSPSVQAPTRLTGNPHFSTTSPFQTKGHAIECRICCEDADNDFFPCTGRIHLFQPAINSSTLSRLWTDPRGVRFDTGIVTGSEMTVFYDPMVCKVIVHAENRNDAVYQMIKVLKETVILGVQTNKLFLQQCLSSSLFLSGQLTTHFIQDLRSMISASLASQSPSSSPFPPSSFTFCPTAISQQLNESLIASLLWNWSRRSATRQSFRNVPNGWRNIRPSATSDTALIPRYQNHQILQVRKSNNNVTTFHLHYSFDFRSKFITLEIERINHDPQKKEQSSSQEQPIVYKCFVNEFTSNSISCTINDLRRRFVVAYHPTTVFSEDETFQLFIHHPDQGIESNISFKSRFDFGSGENHDSGDDNSHLAPMPAKILKLEKKTGDTVKKGELLIVIESMKMEYKITAPKPGKLTYKVSQDQQVDAGAVLFLIE